MALQLSADLRAAIARATRPLTDLDGVRAVRSDQLHLTVRFIGEVDAGRVEAIRDALAEAVRSLPPVDLALESGGAFPTVSRARVAWIGVRATPELHRLHAVVEGALRAVGVEPDHRPFHPHVTVGRIRGRPTKALPRAIEGLSFEASVRVSEVSLIQTRLGRSGARYSELAAMRLDGRVSGDAGASRT